MLLDLPRPALLGSLPAAEPARTRETLRLMRDLTRQYKAASLIRQTAIDLTAPLPPKAWADQVRAVFAYVRDAIRYTRDVRGIETLQTPDATMDIGAGDCDDKSVLLASLLESIGHPTRFVAVGYAAPGEFSHVYVQTRIGPRWISLDPTMNVEAGWSPRDPSSRMVVDN